MNNYRNLLFSAIFLFLFTAFSFAANGKIQIITTLFPEYDFAKVVGGNRVIVRLLLPPGVESHSFDPKPEDILDINRADVFIYTNIYMEPWVPKILNGISNKDLLVVNASNGIGFMRVQGVVDPHVWLDMGNAEIMVNNIRDALMKKDPENRSFYSENARKYDRQLERMDGEFRAAFKDCKQKTYILGGHFAFGYFNRRYGLENISAYKGFSPDAEPTSRDLMELVQKMRSSNIRYVYYEELISPRIAETIAKEVNGKLLLLDGAHNVSKKELDSGVTFLSIMKEDLENLKVGLGCRTK